MTVKEFRKMFTNHKIILLDVNGIDISNKPQIITDCMTVIGSGHRPDGVIVVDVLYES